MVISMKRQGNADWTKREWEVLAVRSPEVVGRWGLEPTGRAHWSLCPKRGESHTPMSSVTTGLLSLYPRTSHPPKMAFKDQSIRVRINIRISLEGSVIWTALDWGWGTMLALPSLCSLGQSIGLHFPSSWISCLLTGSASGEIRRKRKARVCIPHALSTSAGISSHNFITSWSQHPGGSPEYRWAGFFPLSSTPPHQGSQLPLLLKLLAHSICSTKLCGAAFLSLPDCQTQGPNGALCQPILPQHPRVFRALLSLSVFTQWCPDSSSGPRSLTSFVSFCSPLAKKKTLPILAICHAPGLTLSSVILASFVLPVLTYQGLLHPSVISMNAPPSGSLPAHSSLILRVFHSLPWPISPAIWEHLLGLCTGLLPSSMRADPRYSKPASPQHMHRPSTEQWWVSQPSALSPLPSRGPPKTITFTACPSREPFNRSFFFFF